MGQEPLSKVAFSSVLPPATTIERLKGKKRVRLVESMITNDVWSICAQRTVISAAVLQQRSIPRGS